MSSCKPVLTRTQKTSFNLRGMIGDYVTAITEQWLLPAPDGNPGMLEMFYDRDRLPYRDLVPWAGEFAGKYLTGAVQVWRLTGDERLEARIRCFVAELTSAQDDDGYLGPWPRHARLANRVVYPDGKNLFTWDAWGHYHILMGLLLWHEDTGDATALRCACRMADLLCEKYLGDKQPRLCETGSTEMNLAPVHALAILTRTTGNERYLALAQQLLGEFSAQDNQGTFLTGNYLNGPLEGLEFFELPRPRWESLHPIMGMAEIYYDTGDLRCREAFVRIWESIVRGDRHNNGGFSSGEQAIGNPYDRGAIETCCTIAWHAMTVEMLRISGSSRAADELELTLYNSIIGMHSKSGRWATYDTPMDGVRRASAHSIVFQAREGTPELNCCSVNSARGFGMLTDWAIMASAEGGIVVNYYGPGMITLSLPDGGTLTLTQETRYPLEPAITMTVSPSSTKRIPLSLRVPLWSKQTDIRVNGEPIANVKAGNYCRIDRTWTPGDAITLLLDFSLHGWKGHWECDHKTSVYQGPILLTYDRRYNKMDPEVIPAIDPSALVPESSSWSRWMPPAMLIQVKGAEGAPLNLTDFGSAGEGGTPYVSWLPLKPNAKPLPEYFAPSSTEHVFLDLMRYQGVHRRFLKEKEELNQKAPWMTPYRHLQTALRLEGEWKEFRDMVTRLRTMLAAAPVSDDNSRMSMALNRLAQPGEVLHEEYKNHLPSLVDNVRKTFDIPDPIRTFACSRLCRSVDDIGEVLYPQPKMVFTPVSAITDEHFCDIRKFHGGADGVLYIRATVFTAAGRKGLFVYGADGPVKLWVNGTALDCHPEATNPAQATSFRTEVDWQSGENEILFALDTNNGRAWGVFAGLREV